MNSGSDKEAIEDLISSEGWYVFQRLVRQFYNDARFKDEMSQFARAYAQSTQEMGIAMARHVARYETVDSLLDLPQNWLESIKEDENAEAEG